MKAKNKLESKAIKNRSFVPILCSCFDQPNMFNWINIKNNMVAPSKLYIWFENGIENRISPK